MYVEGILRAIHPEGKEMRLRFDSFGITRPARDRFTNSPYAAGIKWAPHGCKKQKRIRRCDSASAPSISNENLPRPKDAHLMPVRSVPEPTRNLIATKVIATKVGREQ